MFTWSADTFNIVQISIVEGSKGLHKLKQDYKQICARMFGKLKFFKATPHVTIQITDILAVILLLFLFYKWYKKDHK